MASIIQGTLSDIRCMCHPENCHYQTMVFDTPLGWVSLTGNQSGVLVLSFGFRTREQLLRRVRADTASSCVEPWNPQLRDQLVAYFHGEPVSFGSVPLITEHETPFARSVIDACRKIPYGQTASYGELARAAGSPRAARAVGSVMARNRVPIVVPCHRVLGAGGRLGGYSAPGGIRTKQKLLRLESGRGEAIE